MFFLARTTPHKKDRHAQHQDHWKELLPIHAANIAAKAKGANGIFYGAAVVMRAKNFELRTLNPKLETMFVHTHRVTYAECTVGDHIYHSRYLDLMEAARGEFIRSLGRTVLALQNDDCIFPVIEARLRYKFPARYDDVLAIEVWPTLVERVRLNFGHRILNQDGKLVLEAETFHACTTRAEKPKRLPEDMAASLLPLLVAGRINF